MTRKVVHAGGDDDIVLYTNAGSAISAGALIVMGHTLAIALVDIGTGESGYVAVGGIFSDVPKVSAAVFAVGEKLIYDVSASAFDDSAATPAAGDITGGAVAVVAGAAAETTCTIKLTPGNTTKT